LASKDVPTAASARFSTDFGKLEAAKIVEKCAFPVDFGCFRPYPAHLNDAAIRPAV